MGIIIMLPLTYVLNIGVIGLGFLVAHLSKGRYKVWIWVGVAIITLVIMLWLYPQDGLKDDRNVVYKVWDAINGR